MKILKKTDLLDLKIKISCTNDIAYMDCALLLDKPEFLSLLPKLRKKYGITELVPSKDLYKWWGKKNEEDMNVLDKYLKQNVDPRPQKVSDDPTISTKELDLPLFLNLFEQETDGVCRKFNRPSYFSSVIQFAIVCGEVGDISYQHTSIEVYPKSELTPDDNPLPEVKINITPMTTLKDVQKVFEENMPMIFERNKKLLNYYYKMKNRKSSNIRRDREWYWRNIRGEGYTKIALSETSPTVRKHYEKDRNRYLIPEYERVKQAIRRYKRYLEVYI